MKRTLEINHDLFGCPDQIILNGKKYYPEYVPEEGEVGEISIVNYSAGAYEFLSGRFTSTDLKAHYIKQTTWVPKPA